MDKEFENYIFRISPQKNNWAKTMEKAAEMRKIPIMDPLSIQFVKQMVALVKPEKILEIGTAIGYSALQMHDAYQEAKIVTIECNLNYYQEAVRRIREHKKEAYIQVMHGDAREKLLDLKEREETFSLVLIDAAKAHYKEFFKKTHPLLKNGGLVISDNVLFRKKVFRSEKGQSRLQKLAYKIHQYNQWLMNQKDYMTTIIPIGDGLALSYKTTEGH